jgi:sulfite reductase alpha subunit-like flavoprotein
MDKEQIYILYGSQTGNAQEIAKTIYSLLLDNDYPCKYLSLNESIEKETFLFLDKDYSSHLIIICSTTGNGDAPENASLFWRKLKNRNHHKKLFQKIHYAVLGLGDSNYNKFNQMGKLLDSRFNELDGKRILDLYCADEANDFEETVDLFIKKILNYFCNNKTP